MRKRAIALLALMTALAAGASAQADPPADEAARGAARALFERSDLQTARRQAAVALERQPSNREALFVEMEAAALKADMAAELQAAVRLCETRAADPRVQIAAERIRRLAANSVAFRAVVPRLRALIARGLPQAHTLRMALLSAASDGLPGESELALARQSGLLTAWRMAGPFGRFANVDFERAWPPEQDGLSPPQSGQALVEAFRFDDGWVNWPKYFARDGVFYAASEISAPGGEFALLVESAGTLEVRIDGASVLRNDDRFRASPSRMSTRLRLAPGRHRVLVKFLASASPFRIAVLESIPARVAGEPAVSAAEARYITAASRYWSGDFGGAIGALAHARDRSVMENFLLAQAWSQAEDASAPEVRCFLRAAVKQSPTALAAEMLLATHSAGEERLEDALRRLHRLLAVQPDFLPAQELRARVAQRLNWREEAARGMEGRLRLHPNCGTLHDAAKFFAANAQYARAAELEQRMDGCAPGSLLYAEALSDAGHHRRAAAALHSAIAARPLDRQARLLLVRELRLAEEFAEARRAAQQLAALAPNSERFRRLAAQSTAHPAALLEDDPGRGTGFAGGDSFYAPYRRDAAEILKLTQARNFSGGPAVVLLHDQVVELGADGSAAVYVHKLTRLLTRAGIERHGEVRLPGATDLLELRTLKADGSVAEPEFSQHKPSVSMPALAPGDVIEQEYVTRYPAHSAADYPEVFAYQFGSFEAPILYARFVVVARPGAPRTVAASPGAPTPVVKEGGAVRIWDLRDIPQSEQEAGMPRGQLPRVRVLPLGLDSWQQVRDFYRDTLIEATRAGARVQQVAAAITADTDEDKTRALYRYVSTRVRGGSTRFGEDVAPAEMVLGNGEGSRTVALVALARAAGLQADLVLARDLGSPAPMQPSAQAYTRPLVRFRFSGGKQAMLDAETSGIGFAALPPTLDRDQALLVERDARQLFVPLPAHVGERSLADGDVTLDEQGNLTAKVSIRLGSWRGSQMRSILAEIPAGGRQQFFEQLALRIFPGATDVRGQVRNEKHPGRPLHLEFTCRSPHFASFNGHWADLDQIVPTLGLRKMYSSSKKRRFALYIDTPFVETTTFRLHLPQDVRVARSAADFSERNEFGSYSARFRRDGPGLLEITRAFDIPAQVIAAHQYGNFAAFAARLDDAERQRITLERVSTSASRR